jgi:hypothetical protein
MTPNRRRFLHFLLDNIFGPQWFDGRILRSASPPVSDIVGVRRHFASVPYADSCTAAKTSYSITSSAISSMPGGMVRPIVFAALAMVWHPPTFMFRADTSLSVEFEDGRGSLGQAATVSHPRSSSRAWTVLCRAPGSYVRIRGAASVLRALVLRHQLIARFYRAYLN